MVVSEDEIVNLLPGAGDEFGLGGVFRQRSEEFVWRRQDTSLDDIDVGRFLHGGGNCGKNKAGRLPLTGPLLLS